jgi:hypothetical protein
MFTLVTDAVMMSVGRVSLEITTTVNTYNVSIYLTGMYKLCHLCGEAARGARLKVHQYPAPATAVLPKELCLRGSEHSGQVTWRTKRQ